MRRFCAAAYGNAVAPQPAACYANPSRRALSTPRMPPCKWQNDRAQRRGPLGFRLRVADVAAGLRLPGAAPRPAGRRPPRALRLFLRAPRHAGKARPGARPRPRRQLPRHRLPRGGGQARPPPSIICARASRSRWSIARPGARSGSTTTRSSSVHALCYMVDRGHRQYAGRLPLEQQVAFRAPGPRPFRQQPRLRAGGGQGDRARKAIATPSLHLLAERLKGMHETAVDRARRARQRAWPATSAIRRAVAVSISSCRRLKNASLSSPGAIGSRISTSTVPGLPQHRAARPEQPGIERDRQARHACRGVKMRDAVFVARLGAGRPPRAFRKDDELAAARQFDARALGHVDERLRAGAAVDRHHAALDASASRRSESTAIRA